MPVVVVESPAKAKTIGKYLGPGYSVVASFGHVRDLDTAEGSVDTDNGFEMKWEVPRDSQKHIRSIASALKEDSRLILATDPDREGEAISWHVNEVLRARRDLKKLGEPERVVFNAVTKSTVLEALEAPRAIDMELVEAYFARRALDYLVGYNLSPVLWRKLPGARSAGRVQSVCLRIIVEREMEIEAFKAKEHWTVEASLAGRRNEEFIARLNILDGKKLGKFGLPDRSSAERAVTAVRESELFVESVESSPKRQNPAAPFVTATLQQEASRKLGFNPRRTMRVAQALYEAGHITYMRTDGVDMAPEAVSAARAEIERRYGRDYLPGKPRLYKSKTKNAQEAHECIRPTDVSVEARSLAGADQDQKRLYDLVRSRTLASQMASASYLQTIVDIRSRSGGVGLTAAGRVELFDGFKRIYVEGADDPDSDSARGGGSQESAASPDDRRLPELEAGESLAQRSVEPSQHFTKPPPRYSEASLVKRMVELGIGRPSTYSSIVATIQDRGYVKQEKNRLHPQATGRLLTSFLLLYFPQYVGYEFTAKMEEDLDEISNGRRTRIDVLSGFWREFSSALSDTSELRISNVLEDISEMLAPHYFADADSARTCPTCGDGTLRIKTARSGGAFFGCSRYPECKFIKPLEGDAENGADGGFQGRLLGQNPSGVNVLLKSGRFGPFVELEAPKESKSKPKRVSLPKGYQPETLDLSTALALLDLPRVVGKHPDDDLEILAGIGRYGPYLKHGQKYASLQDASELFSVGMNRAVELLARKPERRGRQAAEPLKELGEHPDQGGPIRILDGRYGPYVNWSKTNASLPKGMKPDEVTIAMALELLTAKAGRGTKRKPARRKK